MASKCDDFLTGRRVPFSKGHRSVIEAGHKRDDEEHSVALVDVGSSFIAELRELKAKIGTLKNNKVETKDSEGTPLASYEEVARHESMETEKAIERTRERAQRRRREEAFPETARTPEVKKVKPNGSALEEVDE